VREVTAHWLGRSPYAEVLAMQERLLAARVRGEAPDTLLLVEHPPVITTGRGGKAAHVLADEATRARLGVEFFETGRGGDVTYHGPGQLVAYPIFDLKPDRCDVRRYVRDLGRVMVRLAKKHGVAAGMIEGDSKLIGVWADLDAPHSWSHGTTVDSLGTRRVGKIGAIGVRLSRWVTMHGFAFNASTDLAAYGLIVPCGISDRAVTSLLALTGSAPSVEELARESVECVAEVFGAKVTLDRAPLYLGGGSGGGGEP
jgi:lipoyl(octanoyl) transferase